MPRHSCVRQVGEIGSVAEDLCAEECDDDDDVDDPGSNQCDQIKSCTLAEMARVLVDTVGKIDQENAIQAIVRHELLTQSPKPFCKAEHHCQSEEKGWGTGGPTL